MSIAWHEIRDHLVQTSSTLRFHRNIHEIRRRWDPLAPFRDPVALLEALHHGPADAGDKNLILTALVEEAQSDDPASDSSLTMLLLALWPGLDAIRRRSIWRKIGAADEVTSDVLARSVEAIRSLNLERVNWIAATVLRNVERDMIRARQRDVAREGLASSIELNDIPADRISKPPEAGDAHLQDHLRKLIGPDAVLVLRVAIDGFTQTEVALELGLTEAAARKRYQRAIGRLRGALQEIS